MSVRTPVVIKTAEFNPDVRKYWLLSGAAICLVTIVGIPLIPIWYLLGMWITGRYLSHMECVLTEKTLIVRKGIWNRVEKTIPLEKITDLGMVQGPIMRIWDIHAVSIETAGQSGQGALVRLYGIQDTPGFRDDVLAQRDQLREQKQPGDPQVSSAPQDDEAVVLLREIRDLLRSKRADNGKSV